MREAIGGNWLFQIVIVFVLLFTGFMCLTINHTKAFNVKNTIIKTIEREQGLDLGNTKDDEGIKQIISYLQETGYRTTGKCPDGWVGIDRDGNSVANNPAFCIKESTFGNGELATISNYYSIIVFYQLDLPIFNEVFNFKVTGDTKVMKSSFKHNGVYQINGNSICREYKNGKPISEEKSCSYYQGRKIYRVGE